MRYYVFLSDEFLLTWLYENGNRPNKVYQQCFNWFTCVQNSHSAWFLDGRISIFVQIIVHECVKSHAGLLGHINSKKAIWTLSSMRLPSVIDVTIVWSSLNWSLHKSTACQISRSYIRKVLRSTDDGWILY